MSLNISLLRLGSLTPGFKGRIIEFDVNEEEVDPLDITDRLREIGFAENLLVEFLHESPFGRDPIAVRVGSMTVALRRKEANFIMVAHQ